MRNADAHSRIEEYPGWRPRTVKKPEGSCIRSMAAISSFAVLVALYGLQQAWLKVTERIWRG